jgi:hypothetical protein
MAFSTFFPSYSLGLRGHIPILIDSIRLLPHALWLYKYYSMFGWLWIYYTLSQLFSKSFYLRFVEICRWNYWTASPCSLALNIVVACLGDWGSFVPYCKRLFQVNLFRFVEIKGCNYYISYHALWLSIFLLHALVIMDWVWSFMYRIELNRWNFFRLPMISTLISCSYTYFSGPKGQHL